MVPRVLSEYPWVVVTVSCKLCTRRGVYRLAGLAARYGPEMPLDRVLADLAHDMPPGDAPHRQREPAREDMPQRRRRIPEASGRYPMLSDWTAPRIRVTCAKCDRRDVVETEAVWAAMGDVTLVEVRLALTAECPRAVKKKFSDWCAGLLVPED